MSEGVRAGLAGQRQSCDFSDVVVRFCIEEPPEQQREQDEGYARPRRFVGDPYAAHRIILSLGSTFLEARLKRGCWQGTRASHAVQAAGSDCDTMQTAKRRRIEGQPQGTSGDAGGELTSADGSLPEVLVLLSSEEEMPFARHAIDFIYTGTLSARLDFEALLRVRQQACYLGVKYCPQACDEAMVALLQQGEEGKMRAGTDAAAEPRVLQAYACYDLFPQPGTCPEAASFKLVRSALAKQLVLHFGDAVATLSRPDLYQQLLQLPAMAVKELLAADDFGTDSEDSVFLLLAAWLEAQEDGTPEATRAELCGLVRLHRLSRTYLSFVLPAYEPFVISRTELGHLLWYAGASAEERARLSFLYKEPRRFHWYCSPARRQVVREEGRTVQWSISREQLEQGLGEVAENHEPVRLNASFGPYASAMVRNSQGTHVLSRGLCWGLDLKLHPARAGEGDGAGAHVHQFGVRLHVSLPKSLAQLDGAAPGRARIVVDGWRAGRRVEAWAADLTPAGPMVPFRTGWLWERVCELPPAAGVGAGGPQAAAQQAADLAVQLARWSEWMHDGKITGSVTFSAP